MIGINPVLGSATISRIIMLIAALIILAERGDAANDINDAFRGAAFRGEISDVRDLLNDGADVNSRGGQGLSALMSAAMAGHVAVVQVLLERGADLEARSNQAVTSLMLAAMGNHVEVVRLLLQKGATLNARSAALKGVFFAR